MAKEPMDPDDPEALLMPLDVLTPLSIDAALHGFLAYQLGNIFFALQAAGKSITHLAHNVKMDDATTTAVADEINRMAKHLHQINTNINTFSQYMKARRPGGMR